MVGIHATILLHDPSLAVARLLLEYERVQGLMPDEDSLQIYGGDE